MAKSATAGTAGVHLHVHTGARKQKPRDKGKGDVFDQVVQLRATLRPDAEYMVKVWRWNEGLKDYEYLAPIPIADFSLDGVRATYGGGRYRARVTNADGQFIEQGGQWLFPIGGLPKHPDLPAGVSHSGVTPELAMILGELKAMLAAKPAAGGADVGDMALKMATAMAGVQAASMAQMQAMLGKANGGGNGGAIEMVSAILDIAERLRPAPDSDPSVVSMFAGFAEALKEVAVAQRASGQGPIVRRVAAPPAAGAADTTAAQPAAPTEDPMTRPFSLAKLKPYVAQLVSLAKRDKDPATYADVLLDSLEGYPAALAFLANQRTPEARAAVQSQLVAAYPELQPYATWLSELFTALWERIDEEIATETGEGAQAAGDAKIEA